LQENIPLVPGSEEYLHSEKYQLRHWDLNRGDSLKDFITQINHIRRRNPALQQDWNLRFYDVDNEHIICYSKQTDDGTNSVLVVVCLDPSQRQMGTIEIPPDCFCINQITPQSVHELLSDCHQFWYSNRVPIDLDPQVMPVNIFQLGEKIYDYP
jgi:starch synthase (maltosyl-transferring)